MAAGKNYVWRGRNGRWFWRHVSRNGRIDDGAEQGYASRPYARKKAIRSHPAATTIVLPEGDTP